jgi:sugar/nucleoside kinase (ribokinase family)
LRPPFCGAGLQGWLRRIAGDGRVEPARLAEAPEVRAPPALDVAIVSEEDHPDAEGVVRGFLESTGTAAVTRGARGATVWTAQQRLDVPAAPAREVDPTGAGDVFGVVLTLELAYGKPLAVGGRRRACRRRGRAWNFARCPPLALGARARAGTPPGQPAGPR